MLGFLPRALRVERLVFRGYKLAGAQSAVRRRTEDGPGLRWCRGQGPPMFANGPEVVSGGRDPEFEVKVMQTEQN